MADIVLTVPNNQIERVIDALCTVGGYEGDPDDDDARREFARTVLRTHLRDTVLRVERSQATAAAMATVTVNPITVD